MKNQPGRFAGIFRPPLPGHYRVRFELGGETSFDVLPLARDWEDTSPDFDALENLAAETGGRFFGLDELDDLVDEVEEVSRTEVLGRRTSTVWDSAALMFFFCALLAIEWTLRKLWRLN